MASWQADPPSYEARRALSKAIATETRALAAANARARRAKPWWNPLRTTHLTERGFLVLLAATALPAYGVLAILVNTR